MNTIRTHHWRRTAHGLDGEEVFPDVPLGTLSRPMAEHVERYLQLARQLHADGTVRPEAQEALYLVDEEERWIREIVGFRLRGHPLAMLGAVRFPRHERSLFRHGRPSLAFFFSRPPAQTGTEESRPPQGVVEVYLPHVGETIPDMVERCRAHPDARGVQLDVTLLDFAFDLRFHNPSAIPMQGGSLDTPERRLFRTTRGHVLSGISVGYYKTLRKDLQFITLTDAVQHRPGSEHLLPTLALNRRMLALEAGAGGGARFGAHQTMAFHPSTASPLHLLGAIYDHLQPSAAPEFPVI